MQLGWEKPLMTPIKEPLIYNSSRRKFIADLTKVAGAGIFLAMPVKSMATAYTSPADGVTVKQIIDTFNSQIPGPPFTNTVDTLKAGSEDTIVTGIVTTMFATIDVIRKAIDLNANFIIAHEPTFYNHTDETKWLENDSVYQYKINLLNEHKITVWRNHDHIHALKPDGVETGVLAQLGWQGYATEDNRFLINLPGLLLKDLITHAKGKLNIQQVRYIGDLNQNCKKVLLIPGSAGGRTQISAMSTIKPDVLMCGEISEWETAEYVRDANAKGEKLSLVVLGHIASEEPGSEYMLNWLKEKYPAIKSTHIPAQNSLSFL